MERGGILKIERGNRALPFLLLGILCAAEICIAEPPANLEFCKFWLLTFAPSSDRTYVPFRQTLGNLVGKPFPPGTMGALRPGVYRRQGQASAKYPEVVTMLIARGTEHGGNEEESPAYLHLHI